MATNLKYRKSFKRIIKKNGDSIHFFYRRISKKLSSLFKIPALFIHTKSITTMKYLHTIPIRKRE
jgi:hypothetical protein